MLRRSLPALHPVAQWVRVGTAVVPRIGRYFAMRLLNVVITEM